MTIRTLFTFSLFLLFGLLSACKDTSSSQTNNPPTASNLGEVKFVLQEAFPTLASKKPFDLPVGMYQSSNGKWFLIEQSGVIQTFSQNGDNLHTFLNIEDRVGSGGERGLLGMALSPEFASNGIFYVSYTSLDGNSIISMYSSLDSSSQTLADSTSEKILLSIAQPYSNHNGGQISFGPDGLLYIGLGDGGSGGDPKQNGQNTNTLLGAMLRIDVSSNDGTYSIPDSNPFVNSSGKDEIYAYGLRNPWRWSFDKSNGDLWLADVGQDDWEEINVLKSGGNYGWNVMEGNHCYDGSTCDKINLIAPIFEYSHNEGYSITGGYVYRGTEIPALQGYYIYGDYVTKKIWALNTKGITTNTTATGNNPTIENNLVINSSVNISSFAEDNDGNLYVVGHQSGKIYKIVTSGK